MDSHPYVLVPCKELLPLAKQIVSACPLITLHVPDWKRFPDGMPNSYVKQSSWLKRTNVVFLASCDSLESIVEQFGMMRTLARLRPRSFKVLLPYFSVGTMERSDDEGQVVTAAVVADIFSLLPASGPGLIPFYIFDIHALAERDFFKGNVVPVFRSGAKMLRDVFAGQDVSIAFPDEGAYKRFEKMFRIVPDNDKGGHVFPIVVCEKRRTSSGVTVRVKSGKVRGRHVIIVDDLVHSCGTQLSCLKALKKAGAKQVDAYATHAVFDNGSERRMTRVGLGTFYVSDSCAKAQKLAKMRPFKVVSIVPKLVESILE